MYNKVRTDFYDEGLPAEKLLFNVFASTCLFCLK